jgi:acylphosphatase
MTRRYLVSGRVQGVGFRWFVQREATRLGLVGYAANLADGRVEVVASGDGPVLDQLERALGEGPRSAHVTSVVAEPAASTETFTTFSTR